MYAEKKLGHEVEEGGAMHYTLAELALMTGYSTRSLRTFYRQGLLTGTMAEGKYFFSEEDLEHFMTQPFIETGLKTKARMRVQHFLEEEHTRQPSSCLIHDEPDREQAEQLNRILLEYINRECQNDVSYNYHFDGKKKMARFIFIGQTRDLAAILERIGKSQRISS